MCCLNLNRLMPKENTCLYNYPGGPYLLYGPPGSFLIYPIYPEAVMVGRDTPLYVPW